MESGDQGQQLVFGQCFERGCLFKRNGKDKLKRLKPYRYLNIAFPFAEIKNGEFTARLCRAVN